MGLLGILLGSSNDNNKKDDIKLGDRVYVPYFGITGYVQDINGNQITITHTKEDGTHETKTFDKKDVKKANGII